jgi:hypothetical protein
VRRGAKASPLWPACGTSKRTVYGLPHQARTLMRPLRADGTPGRRMTVSVNRSPASLLQHSEQKADIMIIAQISPRTAAKITSVGWHAHTLHERGYGVTVLAADHRKRVAAWPVGAGSFPFTLRQKPSPMFHENVASTLPEGQTGVVPSGHAEERRAIAMSVLPVSDLAIVSTTPTRADVDRIDRMSMREFLDDFAVLQPGGAPPESWSLLNRTVANFRSSRDYRADHGWKVFTTVVPRLQMDGQSVFSSVTPKGSACDELVTEMRDWGMLSMLEVHQ